jgi:flagellar motor switch protein FliG
VEPDCPTQARAPPAKGSSCHIGQIIRKLHTTKQLLNQSQSVADVCHALDVEARVNKPLTAPALRASPCDLAEITDPTVVQLPITSEHPKSQILATGALNR